ncbi:Fibroblast growth factor receptor-like 1 [Goodea atripinnis]|uniref:Fibroblast growth factor receptor-like 1 n=1 Tax=Goodea atripinnis TaxID=208336 RepID=A0ABV0MWJ5_9TELE
MMRRAYLTFWMTYLIQMTEVTTCPSMLRFCLFASVRPRFTEPAKMRRRVIERPVGSSVRLKCTASGNPHPDIIWLKDSKPLADEEGGAGGERKKKRWTLSLRNLTPEHSGKYTCHVSNKAGEINATYKVEVIRKFDREAGATPSQ